MAPTVCCRQYRALMHKHATLAKRARGSTLSQVFIGLAVCLLLYLFQLLANYVLTAETLHPGTMLLPSGPPRCIPTAASFGIAADGSLQPGACTTILYAPSTPDIDRLLQRVAANTGLHFGTDIVALPGTTPAPSFFPLGNVTAFAAAGDGSCLPATDACLNATETKPFTLESLCLPCAFLQDNATLSDWIVTHPNSTQSALLFFGAYLQPFVSGASVAQSYAALFNLTTTVYPFFADPHLTSLKRAMDQAALELAAIDAGADPDATSFELSVAQRGFPVPPPRIVGYDVFSANGGQWIFIVPALSFFFITVELVHEKESRLRLWMKQAGLRTAAFWSAWISHALLLSLASTVVVVASGWAFQYDWFTNSNVMSSFLLFFSFTVAMTALAVLISSLVNSTRTAQTVAYSFILTGFTLQFILTSAYAGTISLLYADQITAAWVGIVKTVLNFYPPFNFALFFYQISALASSTINTQEQKLVKGPGFFWHDMRAHQTRQVMGYSCTLPTPFETLGRQAITAVVFLLLALYLDAVLPGPHGTPSHPLFFLGCRFRAQAPGATPPGSAGSSADPGVAAEVGVAERHSTVPATALAAGAPAPPPTVPDDGFGAVVVRFNHLRVVYRRGWSAFLHALTGWDPSARRAGSSSSGSTANNGTGRDGAGDVTAVHDLCLTVRRNECLALLGHNGCGKSSSISVASGLYEPSGGAVEVCGHDVAAAAARVQQVMGVCPQHDILWPDLSARETCRLFAALKGVPPQEVQAEIERVLHEVRLTSFADRYVGGYSGGMKRRLSMAVAALNKPLIILADEPTSGADPVHRRGLWAVLQRLRKSSSIILTTHSMEEASVLGSRIAIMAHGRLHALGTPLQLKRRYGAGYRLSLSLRDATPDTAAGVLSAVREIVPSISVGTQDAANLVLTVPFAQLEAMPQLLRWVEHHNASAGSHAGQEVTLPLVREFGVSGPTLEAVFLKITAAAKFELAAGLGGDTRRGRTAAGNGADEEDDDEEEEQEGSKQGHESAALLPPSAVPDDIRVGRSRGWYALVAKNSLLLRRQRGLCLCQLGTPLLVLGLLVLLKYIVQVEVGNTPPTLVPSLLLPLNMNQQFYEVTQSYAPNQGWPLSQQEPVSTTAATTSGGSTPQPLSPAAAVSFFTRGVLAASGASMFAHARATGLSDTASSSTTKSPPASLFSAKAFLEGVDLAAPVSEASVLGRVGPWLHHLAASMYLTPSYHHPWTKAGDKQPTTVAEELTPVSGSPTAAADGARRAQVPSESLAHPHKPHPHPGPPHGGGANTDCLLFFLYSITPDDGVSPQDLAAAVGGLPRVYATNSSIPPSAATAANATGLLGHIKSNWCALKNGTLVSAPYMDARAAAPSEALDDELMAVINQLQNTSTNNLDWQAPCWSNQLARADDSAAVTALPGAPLPLRRSVRRAAAAGEGFSRLPAAPYGSAAADDPYATIQPWLCPAYLLPDGTLTFHNLVLPNASALAAGGPARMVLSYTYAVNDLKTLRYHRPSNFSRLGLPSVPGWVTSQQALTVDPARVATQDFVAQAFAAMAGLDGSGKGSAGEEAGAGAAAGLALPHIVAAGTLPFLETQNVASFVEIVGGILYPIALSLQLPLFVFVTVLEKEERLLELQLSMGLSARAYHSISYAMNALLYCCVAGLFWGSALGLQFSFFTHSSTAFVFLLFLGWGLALCSMAVLLAALLWSRKAATILGYSVSLFGTLFAIVIAAGVYGDALPWSTGAPMPTWLYIFPQFAFVRVLYLGTFECVAKQSCWSSWEAVMAPGTETRAALVSLYLCAMGYAALGIYLDAVLPRRYGVRKHPLYFIPADWRRAAGRALSCASSRSGGALHKAPALKAGGTPQRFGELAQPLLAHEAVSAAAGPAALSQSQQPVAVELTHAAGVPLSLTGSLNAPTAGVAGGKHAGGTLAQASAPASTLFSALLQKLPYVGSWAHLLAGDPRRGLHGALEGAPTPAQASLGEALVTYLKGEDADVFNERRRIEEELWPAAAALLARPQADRLQGRDNVLAEHPLIIRHLRKIFDVPKRATQAAAAAPAVAAAAASHSSSHGGAAAPGVLSGASVSDPVATVAGTPAWLGRPGVEGTVGQHPFAAAGSSSAASDPSPPGLQLWGAAEAAAGARLGDTAPLLDAVPASAFATPADIADARRPYSEAEQALLSAAGIKVAVSDLCLALRRGQCLGFLGENGAGKSTTLGMLLGLFEQSGGEALVGGYDTRTEVDLARASLGVALQHDTLWATLTVRETLAFYARIKGVARADEAAHVAAIMADVGLSAFADRAAAALSGGMRRRLTLGTALVGGSSILLADEVTSGLDVATKRRIWRILARAKAGRRRSILLISHDMAEVEFLCDTIGIATFGRLRCLGDSQHLKARYGGGLVLTFNFIAGSSGGGEEEDEGRSHAALRAELASAFPACGLALEDAFRGFASFLLSPPALHDARGSEAAAFSVSGVFAALTSRYGVSSGGSRGAGSAAAPAAATDALRVLEWSVSQQTLEGVFDRVVRHFRADDPSDLEK